MLHDFGGVRVSDIKMPILIEQGIFPLPMFLYHAFTSMLHKDFGVFACFGEGVECARPRRFFHT